MDDGTFQANDHSLNRLVIESRVFTGISNIEYVKFLYSEVVLGVIFKVRSECEQFQPKSRSKTIFKRCRTFSLSLSLSLKTLLWSHFHMKAVNLCWRSEVKWSEAEGAELFQASRAKAGFLRVWLWIVTSCIFSRTRTCTLNVGLFVKIYTACEEREKTFEFRCYNWKVMYIDNTIHTP